MGYLKEFSDFYHLYEKKEELMELEGFGEKSIQNLLDSIEKSKANSLERLLFALGIRHVGAKTAKILARHFQTIDNMIMATEEELGHIYDIGDIIAKSVYSYFQDPANLELIHHLKQVGVNTKYLGKEENMNTIFSGKTFVLTGSLENMTREELKDKLEELGGNVSGSVSNKTDVVIVGDKPGSKYDKALELGITIWNEEELMNNLKL